MNLKPLFFYVGVVNKKLVVNVSLAGAMVNARD